MTDKFYPDFVVQLEDERNLVLEFKGSIQLGNPDTVEKTAIGDLWAKLSDGKGAFLMVGQKDYQTRINAL